MATVTGWGTLSEGALGLPNVLHKVAFENVMIVRYDPLSVRKGLYNFFFGQVDVPVVSDEDCKASYGAAG